MVESIYFLKPAWCGTHRAGLWPEQDFQSVTVATAFRRWFSLRSESAAMPRHRERKKHGPTRTHLADKDRFWRCKTKGRPPLPCNVGPHRCRRAPQRPARSAGLFLGAWILALCFVVPPPSGLSLRKAVNVDRRAEGLFQLVEGSDLLRRRSARSASERKASGLIML
jgi:hypothetical protein